MARLMNGEISSQTKNGTTYYRVSVGRSQKVKTIIQGGKQVEVNYLVPAEFGLGTDPIQARIKRDVYLEVWRQWGLFRPQTEEEAKRDGYVLGGMVEDAELFWTPAMLSRVEAAMNEIKSVHTTLSRSAFEHRESAARLEAVLNKGFVQPKEIPAAPSKTLTLYEVLDQYDLTMQNKKFAHSYKSRVSDCVASLKAYRDDCEFSRATIDKAWLESLTDFVKSRPLSRRKSKKAKAGPISANQVKTLLSHWRRMFEWIDGHSESARFGGWESPKRMERLFDVDMAQLMDKAERDKAADGPEQITTVQIVQMYKGIHPDNSRHQAWFLTALFSAQGQKELSVTMAQEFMLNSSRFIHRRNKTGVKGEFWLPPELVKLLKPILKGKGPEDLVFLTDDGKPIVTNTSDSVRQAWEDWEERAELKLPKGMGFYCLRRYFSDRALQIGGTDLQTAALSQSGKTVGQKFYSGYRDFDAVERVGRIVYDELVAAGMFAAKKEKIKAA